jgi:hypothetical protein
MLLVVLGFACVAAIGVAGWFGLRPPPAMAPPAPVSAPLAPPQAAAPPKTAPAFDIVRVSPQGEAVLAGRAPPDTEVVVTSNGHEIGRTRSDRQGQWVLVPSAPLAPGGQELAVATPTAKGDAPVLLLVPDRPQTASPAPPALAVLAPPDAAPRVLQGGTPGRIGLNSVDYDQQGTMRFAGTAAPNAIVRLYVDNKPVGEVQADAQGRWAMTPSTDIAPGAHRLRLDQVKPCGGVSARVELPFERAPAQAGIPDKLVVQPRQNLWRIAREVYGRGIRYVDIYETNRAHIRDPNLIYPGQILGMPQAGPAQPASSPPSSARSR